MDTLRIRVYNVLFGDAILISFPEHNSNGEVETRNVLIDVGNLLSTKKGGSVEVFDPVIKNIIKVLNGKPLDLYIMTHEHLDHTQGLPYGEKHLFPGENELRKKLKTRYVWFTASAREGYLDDHPKAKKRSLELKRLYTEIDFYLKARLAISREPISSAVEELWMNNNPNKTDDCVEWLSNLSEKENTFYVYRPPKNPKDKKFYDPNKRHPFTEAKIEIWAPEEDTSNYYGRFRPAFKALGVKAELSEDGISKLSLVDLVPPPGVDAGAFYNLVNSREEIYESLLAIDKAANNTSIVFCLEWREYRLLFTGDAEKRSWITMNREGVLKPVHFLKVSHHGSHNGTPNSELLKKILPPAEESDGKPRYAVVSTKEGAKSGVPDLKTLKRISEKCNKLFNTSEVEPGEYIDIKFEAE